MIKQLLYQKTICIRYKHENLRNYIKISRVSTTKKNKKWSKLKGVMLWHCGGRTPQNGTPKLEETNGAFASRLSARKPIQNPRNKWCVDKFAGLLSAQHNQNHSPKSTDSNLFPSLSPSQLFPAHKTSWYCRHLHLIHQEQRFLPTTFLIKAVGVCFQWHNDRGFLLVFVSKHTRCFSNMIFFRWSVDDRYFFSNFQSITKSEIQPSFRLTSVKIPWRIPRMSCGLGGLTPFHVGSVHGFSKLMKHAGFVTFGRSF